MPDAIEINDRKDLAGIPQLWEELETLKSHFEDLQSENERQRDEISTLKATISDQSKKISTLEDPLCQKNSDDFIQLLNYIDARIKNSIKNQYESRPAPLSSGKITEQRIAEVIRLLKSTPTGSMSFKTLRTKMGLKPNQFTRVISSLDNRRFEVTSRPGAPKEKVLRIKACWS